MNYKGNYDGTVNYAVGDAVVFTDNVAYVMKEDAPAGVKPHDQRYWTRVGQPIQEVILMFHTMLTAMNEAIAEAGTVESNISKMIAPEYTKTTYSAGAIVTHSGKLYQANEAIETAEDWTAAHWTEITVGGQVSAANGNIAALQGDVSDVQDVVFDDKTLILASSTESSTKKWAVTVDDSDGLEVNEIVEEVET